MRITSLLLVPALLLALATVGCGGKQDAAVEIDPNDPLLVEPPEVTEFEPEINGGEDAFTP